MAETQIPVLDFSELGMKEGSEGWKILCNKVREACEEFGCFQVFYDKVPKHLHEEMFMAIKSLFDLPEETKKKNVNTRAYSGYIGKSEELPLHQSLGIDDAPLLHASKAFTDLMWPQGNPQVCGAINSMSAKLLELHLLIMKMIFENFGLEKYYASHVESVDSVLRLMQYDSPPPSQDSAVGLEPHTDKTIITILGQDEVHGLQVLSKGGNWIKLQPSTGTFVVLLGDMLKVLSNGRWQGTIHNVEISGERKRYSYGLFVGFKDGVVVDVPNELVDKEHPPLFRPFNYMDFIRYFNSNFSENALQIFAGM